MEQIKNVASVVVFMTDKQFNWFKSVKASFQDIIELFNAYDISVGAYRYWTVQLNVLNKSATDISALQEVYKYTDFLAAHQSFSKCIIIPNEDTLLDGICEVYDDKLDSNFVYDMMSSEERYALCLQAVQDWGTCDEIRFLHHEKGNMYSLILQPQSLFLFSPEVDIELTSTYTGERITVDALNGINKNEIHLVVINSKT